MTEADLQEAVRLAKRHADSFAVDAIDELAAEVRRLRGFVQRFIDLGFEYRDLIELIDLHDEAVTLMPDEA